MIRTFAIAEADGLLEVWGAPTIENGLSALRQTPPTILLPVDCGRKSALAYYLVHELIGPKGAIAYVFDDDVFERAENNHLFGLVRRALGESRNLHETPCHLIEGDDVLTGCALLALPMFFVWSVAVFCREGEMAFLISHDEYLAVKCQNEDRLREVESDLLAFGQRTVSQLP